MVPFRVDEQTNNLVISEAIVAPLLQSDPALVQAMMASDPVVLEFLAAWKKKIEAQQVESGAGPV